jgi:hypothetical protein
MSDRHGVAEWYQGLHDLHMMNRWFTPLCTSPRHTSPSKSNSLTASSHACLSLHTPKHDILLCHTVTSKQCFPDQKRWEATIHILKNLFPCRKHTEEYPYRIQFSDLKSRTWGEPCPESSPLVALGKGGREYVTVRERNWNWAQKSPYLIAHWFRMVLGEI